MSSASDTPKVPTHEDLIRAYDGQSIDWFLQDLVQLVNTSKGLELGITLNIGGSLVSGILIGGQRYFADFVKLFPGEAKGEWAQLLRTEIEGHSAIYEQKDAEIPQYPPNFVHLREASLFSPSGSIPTVGGVLWRGKINAVSGFSLGVLAKAEGE